MNVLDNRTTGKDNNNYQTTNKIYITTNRIKLDVYNLKNHNKFKFASDKTLRKQLRLSCIRRDMEPILNEIG